MLAVPEDAEERTVWSAIESLEEGADLADELAGHYGQGESHALRGSSEAKRALARAFMPASLVSFLNRKQIALNET
jgi:hypothetical protein